MQNFILQIERWRIQKTFGVKEILHNETFKAPSF